MGYLDFYARRTQRNGRTSKEKMTNEIKRNFYKHLSETPSSHEVQATIPEEVLISPKTRRILCMINDTSLNDKKVLDEKYIHVGMEVDIDIGCYVLWQNNHWVLMFREHNTIETHKTFVMRRCNQFVNHRHLNRIWKIPVSIENLTLYSDGLADAKITSMPDPKRMVSFGSNPVTRTLNVGHRVMLGGKNVFRITHLNDFEYSSAHTGASGLIKAMVLQTPLISKDDAENSVAWNDVESFPDIVQGKINGDDKIIYSSTKKYVFEGSLPVVWECDSELVSLNVSGNECKVTTVNDITKTGQKFILRAVDSINRSVLDEKEITITGFI